MAKSRKRKKTKKANPPRKKFSLPNYVREHARKLPFHAAYVSSNMFGVGLGHVIVARKRLNGQIVTATFIVDVYCLGVKDGFVRLQAEYEFEELVVSLRKIDPHLETCAIEYACSIVYGAVDYAQQCGFEPAKEYKLGKYLLEDKGSFEQHPLAFGKDGKPFFIEGPHDNANVIMATLNKHMGEGNYDFFLFAGGESHLLEESAIDELNDDDYDAYSNYLVLTDSIEEFYLKNTSTVEQLYKTDPDKLLEFFENDNDNNTQIVDNLKELDCLDHLFSIFENLIIYPDSTFMEEDEFIQSFNLEKDEYYLTVSVFRQILFSEGESKITSLLRILNALLVEEELKNVVDVPSALKLAISTQKIPNETPEYEEKNKVVQGLLRHLNLHEKAFGPLDFGLLYDF
jgi:hypothetical protein